MTGGIYLSIPWRDILRLYHQDGQPRRELVCVRLDRGGEEDKEKAVEYYNQGYILRGPKLQRLTLRDLKVGLGSNYFQFLLSPFPQLSHLDVSGAELRGGFPPDFAFLLVLPNLRSLVLHAVPGIKQEAIDTISHSPISQQTILS